MANFVVSYIPWCDIVVRDGDGARVLRVREGTLVKPRRYKMGLGKSQTTSSQATIREEYSMATTILTPADLNDIQGDVLCVVSFFMQERTVLTTCGLQPWLPQA
jgi:hypothetical protein